MTFRSRILVLALFGILLLAGVGVAEALTCTPPDQSCLSLQVPGRCACVVQKCWDPKFPDLDFDPGNAQPNEEFIWNWRINNCGSVDLGPAQSIEKVSGSAAWNVPPSLPSLEQNVSTGSQAFVGGEFKASSQPNPYSADYKFHSFNFPFGQAMTVTITVVAAPPPTDDDAKLDGENMEPEPFLVEPNQSLVKQWDLINEGNTTWDVDDDFGVDALSLPSGSTPAISLFNWPVGPGDSGIVQASLNAPLVPGVYTYRYQLTGPRGDFGDQFDMRIQVKEVDRAAVFLWNTDPDPLVTGEDVTMEMQLLNQGSTTWTPGAYQLLRVSGTSILPADFQLPGAVIPGGQVIVGRTLPPFSFGGTFNARYMMVGPNGAFDQFRDVSLVVATRNDCARFISHVDPPFEQVLADPNSSFTKKWFVENCGNTTWRSNFLLRKLEGQPGFPDALPFSFGLVPPTDTVILNPSLAAPPAFGTYPARYRLENHLGAPFGDELKFKLLVTTSAARAELLGLLDDLMAVTEEKIENDLFLYSHLQALLYVKNRFTLDAASIFALSWDIFSLFNPLGEPLGEIPAWLQQIDSFSAYPRLIDAVEYADTVADISAQLAIGDDPANPKSFQQVRGEIFDHFRNAPGGVQSILDTLDREYDTYKTSLPDPLPPGYPLDGTRALILTQISQLEKTGGYEVWVPFCDLDLVSEGPCRTVSLGAMFSQMKAMEDVAVAVDTLNSFSHYAAITEVVFFSGFVLAKVTTVLGSVTVPVELALFGGNALASLSGGLATGASLYNRNETMARRSLEASVQFPHDVSWRLRIARETLQWTLAPPTSSFAVSSVAGETGGSLAPSAHAGSELALLDLSVGNVVIADGAQDGKGTAQVALRNDGAAPLTVIVTGSITTRVGDAIQVVTLTGAVPKTLAPRETSTLGLSFTVLPSPFLSSEGYDLHVGGFAFGPGGAFREVPTAVKHFFAGSPAQLAVLTQQTSSTLARGFSESGEVNSVAAQFLPTTTRGRLLLSFPGGRDFDLHLYSPAGAHVGVEYGSGQVENEIPGVTYSGADTWPQWMHLDAPGSGPFEVKVVSRQSEGAAVGFDLSRLDSPTLPAILDAVPQVTWFLLRPPGGAAATKSFDLTVRETGGSQPLSGFTATLTDLVSQFDPAAQIPASSVGVTLPSVVNAGGEGLVQLAFTVEPGVPDGVYQGQIQVQAQAPLGGTLSTTTEILLVVTAGNIRPIADAGGPYLADEGASVIFDASGSIDLERDALAYRWDVNGDGVWETPFSAQATLPFPGPDDFAGTAIVRVADSGGLTDDDTASVTIRNVAPSVQAGPDVSIPMGASFVGNGSFQDPGVNDTHTLLWDFGDGTTATDTLTPVHPYPIPGNYPVSLTVRDDDGGVGQDALNVEVRPILLRVSDRAVLEGNTGTRDAVFRVTLSEPHAVPVSFDFFTANGTGTAGVDYLAASGTALLAPGETLREVAVTVLGDEVAGEGDETFFLQLVNVANAILEDGEGKGTIADDDIPEADRRFTEEASPSGLALGGVKEGGLAWCDFNGDGLLDALVNTREDRPDGRSRLYFNDGTGAFVDVTATHARGLTERLGQRSAICADVNNDGYLDFARNRPSRIEIYFNKGPGVFPPWSFGDEAQGPNQVIETIADGDDDDRDNDDGDDDGVEINSEGMGFLDYDNDGDLDLVFDNHEKGLELFANRAERGFVFKHAGHRGLSSQAENGDYLAVADYDLNGWVDVLGRKGTSKRSDLWKNQGGLFKVNPSFEERANNGNKGGVAFCDLDTDRDFDIVWTDAGTTQIWRNDGGTFKPTGEPSLSAGVSLGQEDIDGVACGDVDNDGDLDLFFSAASGPSHLFLNESTSQGLRFVRDNLQIDVNANGEAVAFGDSDRDGDVDLLVNVDGGPNQLWENHLNDSALDHYLEVRALRCLGGGRYRDDVGATIRLLDAVTGSAGSPVQEVNGGSGHGSQEPASVHFGLLLGRPAEYIVEVAFRGENGKPGPVVQKHVVPNDLPGYQLLDVKSCSEENQAPVAYPR